MILHYAVNMSGFAYAAITTVRYTRPGCHYTRKKRTEQSHNQL